MTVVLGDHTQNPVPQAFLHKACLFGGAPQQYPIFSAHPSQLDHSPRMARQHSSSTSSDIKSTQQQHSLTQYL
jgi:hypothetical protein